MWWTAYEWVNKNPEWWFKSFIWMVLRTNNVYYYPELQNIEWRADMFIPYKNKLYIIESKVDSKTKQAIKQIKEKYVIQINPKDYEEIVMIWINWNRKKEKVEVEIVFY